MLFHKDMEPSCSYCKHGTQLDVSQVACLKHGIVPLYGSCRKFSYDPRKRQPERPRKLQPPLDSDEVFKL